MMRVLAISGSLRAASSNGAVVSAAVALSPAGVSVDVFAGVGALPHYNPDVDRDPLPPSVVEWRATLAAADAAFLCSPEYAHGVPGSLKNALDWIVSSGEFMHKPVALINASPHARHAHAALVETLTVMMAVIVEPASVTLPLPRNSITADEIVADPLLSQAIGASLAALARAVEVAR